MHNNIILSCDLLTHCTQVETPQVQLNWTHFQLTRALACENGLLRQMAVPQEEQVTLHEDHQHEIHKWILLEIDPFCNELSNDSIVDAGTIEDKPDKNVMWLALHAALLEPVNIQTPDVCQHRCPHHTALNLCDPSLQQVLPVT